MEESLPDFRESATPHPWSFEIRREELIETSKFLTNGSAKEPTPTGNV